MLQYLIIVLDDTSISYCHYSNKGLENRLIGLEDLKAGVMFAMKEDLTVQFVYPSYDLPQEYKNIIDTVRHSKIVPAVHKEHADVVVLDGWIQLRTYSYELNVAYVLRTVKKDFFRYYTVIGEVISKISRLNVIITDIETFTGKDFEAYQCVLSRISFQLEDLHKQGKTPQLNLLTDRLMLSRMNNCNSGWESVTLAPNGNFYVCPAFYYETENDSIGDLKSGLDIKNSQLYRLDHAPLCRNCDAYQCRRCIYLNRKMTNEVNTPSHEQCVVAHLERNASRLLLSALRRQIREFLPGQDIKELVYLDPLDIRKEF